jgi:hypothetical protein
MWFFRAFIFSLSIALLAAVSSPARATTNLAHLTQHTTYSAIYNDSVSTKVDLAVVHLAPLMLAEQALSEQNKLLSEHDSNLKRFPNKTPAYESRFNPNLSLPPFERQAASAFGTVLQNEPIFVLSHEFLPEILGSKYFLAPLQINSAVPWYLRPDAANNHGRLAGWKDGNTLYTGTITYLS